MPLRGWTYLRQSVIRPQLTQQFGQLPPNRTSGQREFTSTGWAFLVNLTVEEPKLEIAPYLHYNSSRRFLQQLTESRGICE